jgi:TetR/AcrR family transcriptional regulator, transcriptional repressor of bet genes
MPRAAPRRKPRPKFTRDQPEVRRRKLIDATARCLAEFGLAGTSVRQICAKAGVSPGLLAHHFAGIDELIVETYRHTGRQVSAVLTDALAAAPDDPEAKLRAFIEASFKPPLLDPDLLAIWLTFWSLVRRNSAISSVHAEVYADYRRTLEPLIAATAERNGVAINARLTTLAFTAMMDGLWLELCLDPTVFNANEAQAIACSWIEGLKVSRSSVPADSLARISR